jgi:hypothetical protein
MNHNGMACVYCTGRTVILDSRRPGHRSLTGLTEQADFELRGFEIGPSIIRKRKCTSCEKIFATVEFPAVRLEELRRKRPLD